MKHTSSNFPIAQISVSSEEAQAIRATLGTVGRNQRENTWAMAECLYKVKYYSVDGIVLWESYGYASYADFVRSETDISEIYAYILIRMFRMWHVSLSSVQLRAQARLQRISSLVATANIATRDNAEAWLRFMSTHTTSETTAAASVASKYPALRDEPEKCFARSERAKLTKSATGLSKKDQVTWDTCVLIARRVMKKPDMKEKAAVMACLNQFVRLVTRGEAGQGWSHSSVDVDAAAEE